MQFLKHLCSCLHNIRLNGINACLVFSVLCAGNTAQSFFFKQTHKQTQVKAERPYATVRVLLKTVAHTDQDAVVINCTGEFLQVYDQKNKRGIKARDITLQVKKGVLYINGKKYRQSTLSIQPLSGHICIDGKSYDGSVVCAQQHNEWLIINEVPREEYICSVLHTESWPGWPLEVNKVFAVTSRTYVISMIMQAEKTKRPYHVHNCNRHQTYQGKHDKQLLKDAVKQTEGLMLTHEGRPIIAMFDSCCGGVIPAHIADAEFAHAPYLARTYPCTHCKRCWIYNWQATLTADELRQCLQKQIKKVKTVRGLQITQRDKAGLVQQVLVHNGRKKVHLDGKQLYGCLKQIKSFCYTVTKEKNAFTFHGRGYGHHLGLCQWGAREMVRDGWDYRRILRFYYPGIQFTRCA